MHPEIEKLIKLAIADGVITEKERGIILRKAEKLGEEIDEVEMIIDGEIALASKELNKNQFGNSLSSKEGNFKKCPSCGASVKSFQINCEDCGHEFKGTKAEGYLEDFKKMIGKSISEKHILIKYKVKDTEYEIPNEISKDKAVASLIKSYPLPNNKTDIIELLIYAYSNFESDINKKILGLSIPKPVKYAWYSKAKQALELLEVYGEKDEQSQIIINRYRNYFKQPIKSLTPTKKNRGCLYYIFMGFLLITVIGVVYNLMPLNKNDKKIKDEIILLLEKDQIDSAVNKVKYIDNTIEKKKSIDKILKRAIELKDFENAKKVIRYYDNDFDSDIAERKIHLKESE